MSDLHLEHIRREYSSRKLSKSDVPENPTELLRKWLEEAVTLKVNEPTAMLVATATRVKSLCFIAIMKVARVFR